MNPLPESKYPDDINGIKEEWLAADAKKRKDFFCWLNKLTSIEMFILAVERDCKDG